jgi:hypothetical protein
MKLVGEYPALQGRVGLEVLHVATMFQERFLKEGLTCLPVGTGSLQDCESFFHRSFLIACDNF